MCCLQNLASKSVKLLPTVSLRISNDGSCLQSVMINYDSGWYNQIEKVYFSHVLSIFILLNCILCFVQIVFSVFHNVVIDTFDGYIWCL